MSGDIRVTKKALLGIALGAIIVAITGVLLGNWFVGWRAEADEAEIFSKHFDRLGTLRKGMQPPAVELTDLDGNVVSLRDIVAGKNTVILLLSIGCDPCTDAVERWRDFKDDLPPDLHVIGINNGDCTGVSEYIAETKMPYPVYCDADHSLPLNYDMNQFPSIMGISQNGTIAFLGPGVFAGFTPQDAMELIQSR
ncbi:MAG: redoxin domain-containing protein [Candidatus Zixiibacteriota bacterium]